MAPRTAAAVLAVLGALVACDSVDGKPHLEQPFIVQQGAFTSGSIPQESADGPTVTSLSFALGTLRPGARSVPFSGRVTDDGFSVAVSLEGQGSGFWTRQVGSPDPTFEGELTFDLLVDISQDIEPGLTTFLVSAVDADGKAGEPSEVEVCIANQLPDNGNACDPTISPPQDIVSLRWNSDADLDLVVVSPSGRIYNRSRRGLAGDDGTLIASFDLDSNSGCVLDNRRVENFVFNEVPEVGTWLVFVDLFDVCTSGAATNFDVTTHERRRQPDDTFALRKTSTVHGTLLRSQVDGGKGTPLYVTSFDL